MLDGDNFVIVADSSHSLGIMRRAEPLLVASMGSRVRSRINFERVHRSLAACSWSVVSSSAEKRIDTVFDFIVIIPF